MPYPILPVDLQVGFHFRLKSIKDLYFHEALSKTVSELVISDIDRELQKYVSNQALQKLAAFSLRGEVVFPIPILLKKNPYLLGYYRLLYGFSQKEFYSKGPFGIFKGMEEKALLPKKETNKLVNNLCQSLVHSGEFLVKQIDEFSIASIAELQLLTVGPQFRGSKNVELGQLATQATFSIIKDLLKEYIVSPSPTSIKIKNDSEKIVTIQFASDPDIAISQQMPSSVRRLIAIEIKGGRDISNIHNRIGEAEKSHQKAKAQGYVECMTIISVDIDYKTLRKESPTTNNFFHLDKLADKNSDEHNKFKDIISSSIGVNLK